MKCVSCAGDINNKMVAALKLNKCPYCGNIIMDPAKLQQMLALQDHLGKLQITNDPATDTLIRDKVITSIIERFEVRDTVIAIPTIKIAEAPVIASEKEIELIRAQVRSEVVPSVQTDAEMQAAIKQAETEGMTEAEIKEYLKTASTTISPKADRLKGRAPGKGGRAITPAGEGAYTFKDGQINAI